MIEKFDRTPRGLKAPMCQQCSEPMIWYRSTRSEVTRNLILHYFQCPKCSDIRMVKAKPPEADR